MKILITALLSMILISTACEKEDKNDSETPATAQTLLNVSYGNDTAQRMDIYLPKGRTVDSTKVMVLIHGGAWADGDKRDSNQFVTIIQQRLPDYAIFNINYRLATQAVNHFPAQEQDVQAAINHIVQKNEEYLISENLVLLGASAGGHLALLHAYKHTNPVKAKAVISFFGPTDLVHLYNNPANPYIPFALQILIGGTPTSNPTAYEQSSPITFVNAQSAPTLLLHGSADGLVPASQSTALHNKLVAAGATSELKIYEGKGHDQWDDATLTDAFNLIMNFIEENVE